MTGQGIGDVDAGTIWPRLRRALKTSALVLYGVAAASGALFSPLISIALGVTFAVTGAAVVALLHQCPADDLPPPPHPLVAGSALACLPAAIAGSSTFGAPSGLGIGLGLALAILLGGHWFEPPPERPPSSGTVGFEPPGDERSLRDLLRDLPTDLLFDEWRRIHLHEVPAGGQTAVDVGMRDLLIDEMQRRDPGGTSRWLAEHPDDPPDGYVSRLPA